MATGDIATLGVAVDFTDITQADVAMRRMGVTGENLERTLKRTFGSAEYEVAKVAGAIQTGAQQFDFLGSQAAGAGTQVTNLTNQQARLAAGSTITTGRINSLTRNMAMMAAATAGANTRVGMMSTQLAIMGGAGLGAIAGITAVVLLIERLTRASREARRELKAMQASGLQSFDALIIGDRGQLERRIRALEAEQVRLLAERDRQIRIGRGFARDESEVMGFSGVRKAVEAAAENARALAGERARLNVLDQEALTRARALQVANEERLRLGQQEVQLAGALGSAQERLALWHRTINELARLRTQDLSPREFAAAQEAILLAQADYEAALLIREERERELTVLEARNRLLERAVSLIGHGALGNIVGGAAAGYQTGKDLATAFPALGLGAAAGPAGAALGGLVGVMDSIFSSGRRAAEALKEFHANLDLFAASVQSDLAQGIAQVAEQARQLREELDDTQTGRLARMNRRQGLEDTRAIREYEAALDEINRLEAERVDLLREQAFELHRQQMSDLAIRGFAAGGGSNRAVEDLRFAEQQRRERAEAANTFGNLTGLGFIDNAIRDMMLRQLDAVQAAEREARAEEFRQAQIQIREDLELRRLRARGLDDEADALGLLLSQQREYADAVKAGADAATLAALSETHRVEAIYRSMGIIQNTIGGLTSTIDILRGAQSDLMLDSRLSPLSPVEQLKEARRRYQETLGLSQGEDSVEAQRAAARLPEQARQLLDLSRLVNASGGRYQADFTTVIGDLDALAGVFEAQRTIEEDMLETLRRIAENTDPDTDDPPPPPPDDDDDKPPFDDEFPEDEQYPPDEKRRNDEATVRQINVLIDNITTLQEAVIQVGEQQVTRAATAVLVTTVEETTEAQVAELQAIRRAIDGLTLERTPV